MSFRVHAHPDVQTDIVGLPDIPRFIEPWGELYRELEKLESEGANALAGGSQVDGDSSLRMHQMERGPLVAFVCSERGLSFHIVHVAAPVSEREWREARGTALNRLCIWLDVPS